MASGLEARAVQTVMIECASMDENAPESLKPAEAAEKPPAEAADADCNGHAPPVAAPEQPPDTEAKDGEALVPSGRKHRTAALQAAEVIALQAEQSELADLIDEEEAEGFEAVRGPFDPLTSQVAKGPRTIRKRNPDGGHAGGFGTSQLLRERSGLGPNEEIQVAPQQNEELKAELVLKAAAVRDIMGFASERGIALREVLKGGVLSGQPVYFQSRHGPILNKGTLTQEGQIACECKQCRPGGVVKTPSVSCSEFEEHAGSRERRPAESIYLECIAISLKEFCNLVNAEERCEDRHAASCAVCGDGGDLLCCDACPTAVHPACIGMESIPEGEWFCQACTERGCVPKAKQISPIKKQKPKLEKPIARSASKSAGAPKKSSGPAKKSALSVGSVKSRPATGRVHMAAPAQRAVSGARRERNSNKHKRLFLPGEPGGLTDGQPVAYITSQGEELLKGSVRIDPDPAGTSGILCACCDTVISCSQFESHAGRGSRRAPYDNIFTADGLSLRKVASMMPSDEAEAPLEYQKGPIGAIADRRSRGKMEPELIHVAGEAANQGGCVLCNSPDFLRGGFGDRTMIICDQCEREFHIGCLAEHGRAKLTELPDGAWFCSPDCHRIAGKMRSNVSSVPVPLDDKYSWQILRGKDGTHATAWALRAAQDILTESFDPIVELTTGADLMMAMVYAQELGDWDYSGMYTAVLKFKGKAVCAAVFRVFGPQMAEVPLVATRLEARRQGHARVLMDAFESYFASLGVAAVCLPSAQETIVTWTAGFGFQHMTEERLAATRSELHVLVFPGTELLYKPLNPAPQEVVPGAETYPMRIAKPSQQEDTGPVTAAAAASEGVAAAERPQQTPEERAAAMAAAEKAVAPPASEDVSISVGVNLPQICPAPAPAGPVENGVLENGHTVEHAEVSSPRALEVQDPTKNVAPAEPALAESAPALQNGPIDTAAPAANSAQPSQDTTVPSSAPEDPAAEQPGEASVPVVVTAEAATADAKPEAEAEAKHADSSAGADPESKKRSRPADEATAPEQALPEQAPPAEVAPAASEPAASEEEASRKKRKVVAAEEAPDAAVGMPAKEVPEEVSEQSAQAAEPKTQKKRKAASADLDAVQAAGAASTTPESQPSKSLSRRSLRSNHAVQDTAAAGEAVDSVSKPVPAAEANPGTGRAKAKPRRRVGAAELAALEQTDVMPTDSPRHDANGQQPASRRALRSQTSEPDQAATPRARQLASAKQPVSKRTLRSQSSMPRDGAFSREGSRAGTAAASPEEGGAPLGSGQPGPGSVPSSAAVQRLLSRSMSPRRRTRSNAQEHITAADIAAGESLPCVQAASAGQLVNSKGAAADQVPPEDQSLPGRAADAEKKAEPVLDAAADPAAVEAETDVLPTPVDVPVSHEAALSGQDKLESSQPGKDADLAKEDPIDVPVQDSAPGDKQSKKARRSSGLREILSLALELGASADGSAVPVTWDGSADSRRASRAKPAQTLASPPPAASAAKVAKTEEGAKAGASPNAAKAGSAGKDKQPPQNASKGKTEKVAAAASNAKKVAKAPKQAPAKAPEAAKPKPADKASKAAQRKSSTPVVKAKQKADKAASAKKSSHTKDAKTKPAPAKATAPPSTAKRRQKEPPAQPPKRRKLK